MREIKTYGGSNNSYTYQNANRSNTPQAYEPPPEIQARYRNFDILTKTALVLLLVLLIHSLILVSARVHYTSLYIKELVIFFDGILILGMLIALWRGYDYINHSLSYTNMITIIITEVVLLVAQFVLCNFCVPHMLKYMIILSIAFMIYALIFIKCKFIFRFLICIATALVLVATNYTHLHRIEFTPRYIYITESGYKDKISDEVNYYYQEPVNQPVMGQHPVDNLLEEINTMIECSIYMSQVEESQTIDYLKYFDVISREIFEQRNHKLSDIVNFNGKYDDSFFKKYGLCVSAIELENPNDTIKCTDFRYSLVYGKPIVEYTRSDSPASEEKAMCIILFEVSNTYRESLFFHTPPFNTRKSGIRYC